LNNNPQRSRLTGRPKNNGGNAYRQLRKVTNWKERSNRRADWGEYVKEAKVRTGVLCRRRIIMGRRRRRRKILLNDKIVGLINWIKHK
jgi:hypothetical protein